MGAARDTRTQGTFFYTGTQDSFLTPGPKVVFFDTGTQGTFFDTLTIVMVMEIIISDDNYMKVEIMPRAKKPILLANAGKSARVLQLISLSMTTSKEMPMHSVIVK